MGETMAPNNPPFKWAKFWIDPNVMHFFVNDWVSCCGQIHALYEVLDARPVDNDYLRYCSKCVEIGFELAYGDHTDEDIVLYLSQLNKRRIS